jgi:hypothetical protein
MTGRILFSLAAFAAFASLTACSDNTRPSDDHYGSGPETADRPLVRQPSDARESDDERDLQNDMARPAPLSPGVDSRYYNIRSSSAGLPVYRNN